MVFDGRDVPLSHREAELLKGLYEQRTQVRDRVARTPGRRFVFQRRSFDVFITRLRKHLSDDPRVQIVNVRGIGHKLIL